jgi:signal transduction histidine kinase
MQAPGGAGSASTTDLSPGFGPSGGVAWTTGAVASPWAIVMLALLAAVVTMAGLIVSPALVHPLEFSALAAWSSFTFVAAGVYWRTCRPGNRLGALQITLGFAVCLAALQGVGVGALHAIGVLFEGVVVLLAALLILAFPSGRLDRLSKVMILILIGAVVVGCAPWILTAPEVHGLFPLERCAAACPANALQIVHRPPIARGAHAFMELFRIVFALGLLLVIVRRIVTASRPRRRGLATVTAVSGLWLTCFAAYGIAVTTFGIHSTAAGLLGFGATGAQAALPLALLVAPMQSRAFAGVALERIVRGVDDTTRPAEIERLVADTLDDPRLRLAFWVSPGRFVDAHGGVVAASESAVGRTIVDRGAEPVLVIEHDAALSEEPELMHAVGSAVLLVMDKRTVRAELQRSSRRLVSARQAERRQLQRDLHDSAQQRLIALRIHLDLIRETADDPRVSHRLGEAGDEVDEALSELRSITHGIFPPELARYGLGAALTAALRQFDGRVRVEPFTVRTRPEVEAAVYLCILEATQNAVKHAGDAARVLVSIGTGRDGDLRFSVTDDGAGFDTQHVVRGLGLQSMADRIEALGGTLDVGSAPGTGTRVSGAVPSNPIA